MMSNTALLKLLRTNPTHDIRQRGLENSPHAYKQMEGWLNSLIESIEAYADAEQSHD